MPVTAIDQNTALIAIDLQKGILAKAEAGAAEAFHARGPPVIWVTVTGRPKGRTQMRKPGAAPADYAMPDPRLPIGDGDLRATIATDAVTDFETGRGRGSLEHAMPGFAELGTAAEVIAALGRA